MASFSAYLKRIFFLIFVFGVVFFGVHFFKNHLGSGEGSNFGWAVSDLAKIHNKDDKFNYDIIVFGGDPEGISAAVSSARAGATVLLLSYEDDLGGLMTYGWLNSIDMNYNASGDIITKGIFLEFYNAVGGDSFDIDKAKTVFKNMVDSEKNITYKSGVSLEDVIVENGVFKGVKIIEGSEHNSYYGRRIIDATQDGDLCTMAGCSYTYGQEDMGITGVKMAVTLVFKVDGVDWNQLKTDIKNRGNSSDGINSVSAWGFGDIYKSYTAKHDNMRLRGLNIGRQEDGSVLINALQIFDVDSLSYEERQKAKTEGAVEAESIVEFLKQYLTSFENAKFAGTAPELYVRESRHIKGEYVLQIMDLLENRDFEDKIALGSYPLDVQATSLNNTGFVMGNPKNYSIPMRCIVPLNVENCYIVGRSASFTSLAASSSRVIPVGMAVAESAGISAVYSIINDVTPREILSNSADIKNIQDLIISQGGFLDVEDVENPYENEWAYLDVRKLITLGLVVVGYDNSITFDKVAGRNEFCNLVINGATRLGINLDDDRKNFVAQYFTSENLNVDIIARIAIYLVSGEKVDLDMAYQIAKERNLLSSEFFEKSTSGCEATRDLSYNSAVWILESLLGREIDT